MFRKLLFIVLLLISFSAISFAQTQGAQTTEITDWTITSNLADYHVSFNFTQDSTGSQASPSFTLPLGVDPSTFTFVFKGGRTAVSGVPNKEVFLQTILAGGDTVTVDTLIRTATNQRETDTVGYRNSTIYGGTHIPLFFAKYQIFIRVITADVDSGRMDLAWKIEPAVREISRTKIQ